MFILTCDFLYFIELQGLSSNQLTELYDGMECTIKEYSETLVSELALRDELEYEKELKNTFISLLLSIQNKRRMLHMDKKQKNKKNGDNKLDEASAVRILNVEILEICSYSACVTWVIFRHFPVSLLQYLMII